MNIQRKRIRIDSKISRNTAFTSPRKDKREIDILLELSLNTIPRKSISPEAYEIAERYFTKGDKRMAET